MVHSQDSIVSTDAERYLLIYMIGVLVVVSALIIIFFVVFQKRKNKLLIEKIKQQQAFEEELAQTQIEISEQTLKNVGQELHDNVGQLLAYANMQLNLVSSLATESVKSKVEDTKDVISNTIQEVRSLSKSLNSDVISNFGLVASIENEVDRINKLKKIKATLNIEGKETNIKAPKDEIILFRIIQEFISNTIKYADASHLEIKLDFNQNALNINVMEDGKGFDLNTVEKGSGLINMQSRADLINADFRLNSSPRNGTEMILIYPN